MIADNSPAVLDEKSSWFSKPEPGHLVQFYKSSTSLILQLTEFIGTGLRNNDTCVVIATPTHLQMLNEQLKELKIDVAAAKLCGQYVVLEASETLAKFMVNGLPDRTLFFDVVGKLVEKFSKSGQPIRAYGEMVALLWKKGNRQAVIQLENLWNELAALHDFSLFCAYPELHFIMDKEMPAKIRECHNVSLSLNTGGLATSIN
jgi:hypothetical protein